MADGKASLVEVRSWTVGELVMAECALEAQCLVDEATADAEAERARTKR